MGADPEGLGIRLAAVVVLLAHAVIAQPPEAVAGVALVLVDSALPHSRMALPVAVAAVGVAQIPYTLVIQVMAVIAAIREQRAPTQTALV